MEIHTYTHVCVFIWCIYVVYGIYTHTYTCTIIINTLFILIPPPPIFHKYTCDNTMYAWPLRTEGFWPQFSLELSSFQGQAPRKVLYCFWCVMRSNYECLSVASASTERFIVHAALLISALLAIVSD